MLALMPIVLVTADGAERSGYTYDDRTGISYEYPKKYDGLIQSGERFVYNKPGFGYAGLGVVGDIRSSANAGNLVCEILDYSPFARYVSLKDPHGEYYEADPAFWQTGNVYWARGVRPLSAKRFEQIADAAGMQTKTDGALQGPQTYASPDVSAAVDLVAMRAAMAAVREWFAGENVHEMPKNNPGFDIRVGSEGAEVRFVEVKGTQAGAPLFFLTEGERKFSIREAPRYTMAVVSGIDIAAGSHTTITRQDGAVDKQILEPTQWRGNLAAKQG